MTDDSTIVIKIDRNVHPQLFNQIKQRMADLDCKTYPELLVLVFDERSLTKRIKRSLADQLKMMGLGSLIGADE